MKKMLMAVGLLAFLAVLPAVHAADATGTWKGKFDLHGTSMPLTFHLTVAAGAVTGTVEGLPTTPVEIHDGKVNGDTLTFWLSSDYEGQSYKLVYTGKVSPAGDEIAFTFGTEDQGWSAQMTAERSAESAPTPVASALPATVPAVEVSGTWKGALDYDGASVPIVFHLTNTAGVVTGTVEGLATTPIEIHDGKIDGDTIAFWLNSTYQGQTYKLVCKGKIASGQIAFTVGTEDGSWGTQVTATKGA
jgi:hypothetical protein